VTRHHESRYMIKLAELSQNSGANLHRVKVDSTSQKQDKKICDCRSRRASLGRGDYRSKCPRLARGARLPQLRDTKLQFDCRAVRQSPKVWKQQVTEEDAAKANSWTFEGLSSEDGKNMPTLGFDYQTRSGQ